MALPKSVTKVKFKQGKAELTFTDNVDRVNYTIDALIRRANMDVGKFLIKIIQQKVKGINKQTSKAKYMPKRYQYWARKKENDLQIGVENTKYGAESAWWADQSELGTNGQPKRGFIRDTVDENIQQIREIQSKYLSAIEDALEAERIANEMDAMDDKALDE